MLVKVNAEGQDWYINPRQLMIIRPANKQDLTELVLSDGTTVVVVSDLDKMRMAFSELV